MKTFKDLKSYRDEDLKSLTLNVFSIFTSISGEVGEFRQGSFTTFIRLAGCNLRCSYCDTPKSWLATSGKEMTIKQILDAVDLLKCRQVLITGGEPLLQESLLNLLNFLNRGGYEISIETNGSRLPFALTSSLLIKSFIYDYKLPGSEMNKYMLTSDEFNSILRPSDWIKFVCCNCYDYAAASRFISEIEVPCKTAFSATNIKTYQEIIDGLIKANNYRHLINVQLHKTIYPDGEENDKN